MSALELKIPETQGLLKQLEGDKDFWNIFLAVCEVPRGSGNMAGIQAKVRGMAKDFGFEGEQDETGNILIRIPGSAGSENAPGVCVQAHMDMVVQWDKSKVNHDPLKDPIRPQIVGKYLMAKGTSLGADNGMGLAGALLLAKKHKEFKHPPLELLFTINEETGLDGANGLKKGQLKSRFLINADSEEQNAICVGCAGGCVTKITVPISRVDQNWGKKNVQRLRMEFVDFEGGHTGVDIEKHRANPLKVVARLLKEAEQKGLNPLLVHWKGGNAHNAIPRDCEVEVVVNKAKVDEFKALVNKTFEHIKHEHKSAELKGMKIEFKPAVTTMGALDEKSTRKIVDFMNILPFGPLRFSPSVPGLVETSYAVTVIELGEKSAEILGSIRSSSASQMVLVKGQITSMCNLIGVPAFHIEAEYPGWEPNMESVLLQKTVKVHKEQLKTDPRVYAIHAGLECGIIMDKCEPGMQALSIGPEIHNPHGPSEELLLESVPRFLTLLMKTLESLA